LFIYNLLGKQITERLADMEEVIRKKFTEAFLVQAADCYGVKPDEVKSIGGFANMVYAYDKDDQSFILRIGHHSMREADQVAGEIEWMDYLGQNGIPLARPVRSRNGRWVEMIGEPADSFIAVSFERAAGNPVTPPDWTPELFRQMGQLLGRMHRLTKSYRPSRPEIKRMAYTDEVCRYARELLPQEDAPIKDCFNRIYENILNLSQTEDVYGLVHTDVHRGNFFLDQGKMTLFDFDDCQYSWFADDIAMALFYAIPLRLESPQREQATAHFFTEFMRGYVQENELPKGWFKHIPDFLAIREIVVYSAVLASGEAENLSGWGAQFMMDRRQKIIDHLPFIEMDFESLISQI
jgi:Ser/Thr protein kinase RdoA (MazF antagonist)